jgi:hypothetical protein
MFLGDHSGPIQSEQECVVSPYHLSVLAVCHGLDKDGVAVDFHYDYDVLVALKRLSWELAGLVEEHGFAYHVCLGVHIAHFLAMEVGGVACFQWHRLCFGGLYPCLVWFRCPFCGFNCLGVVLLDVAFSQHQPAQIVAHFDGFEPSQFDLVSTDGVHPFDGLLSQWEIVDTSGLM